MRKLILASQSPRRKELLEAAGYEPQTLTVEVSETIEKNLTLQDAIIRIAQTKGEAVFQRAKSNNLSEFLILSGDTVVVLNDEVLGKPKNFDQAVDYLTRLSGKAHRVMTSVFMIDETGRRASGIDVTEVVFRVMSQNEIQEYVMTGEPMDKAGAYAIQGLAKKFVTSIVGEMDTVVGLPIRLVERLLSENGWHINKTKL